MEPKTQTDRQFMKFKRPLLFGLVVLAGLGVAYGLTAPFEKPATSAFATVTDLPQGASVDVLLETKSGMTELKAQNANLELPDPLKTTLVPPYRLNASVKLPNDAYRDFTITVGKDKKIAVVTDGFRAGDLVFLTLNGQEAFGRVPADWSGKLELATILPESETVDACISVISRMESLGLCHAIAERRSL